MLLNKVNSVWEIIMSNIFQSKKTLQIYGIGVLAAAVLCTIVRLLCLLFFFDKDIGYYKSSSALPIFFNILLIACVLAAVLFCFIPKAKLLPIIPQRTKAIKFAAILPAVGFAAYAINYFLWLIEYMKIAVQIQFLDILTLIVTIGGSVFFAFIPFKKMVGDIPYVLTGICAIMTLIFALAECYFNTLIQMNSPNKIIFQFACLAGTLFIVNELRQGLEFKRLGFHLFSASIASIFLLSSSIPSIVAYLAGYMPTTYSLFYIDILIAFIAIFSITRLIQMCFGTQPRQSSNEKNETDASLENEALTEDNFNNEENA